MTEAISDVMSNLRDHTPTLPSLKAVDTSVFTEHLPQRTRRNGIVVVAVGLLATVTALAAYLRRRRNPSLTTSPSMYTPPLPKP